MKKINKKGFTLIELLVVIAIIGLLSTLAVVSLNNARQKARDARRQSDLKQISTAMELYMSEKELYPTCVGAANPAIAGQGAACAGVAVVSPADTVGIDNLCEVVGSRIYDGTNTFLANIPTDPSLAGGSHYHYEGNANTYCISALLEQTSTYFVCTNGSCFNNAAVDCTELATS